MGFQIAIDGPAGAGKSTIAKRLAKELDFIYVDTGAMYRAMALYFMEKDVDTSNEELVTEKCRQINVKLQYEQNEQRVILNGENVNDKIRTEQVGNMASIVSAYPSVRTHLRFLQQDLAEKNSVIMDGRDIGTCVLPNADLKIFLTASVETRAKRRYDEHLAKGETADLEQIKKDIEERDYRDMTRSISPLKKAEDAILVDTSHMNIDEVVACIREKYLERV